MEKQEQKQKQQLNREPRQFSEKIADTTSSSVGAICYHIITLLTLWPIDWQYSWGQHTILGTVLQRCASLYECSPPTNYRLPCTSHWSSISHHHSQQNHKTAFTHELHTKLSAWWHQKLAWVHNSICLADWFLYNSVNIMQSKWPVNLNWNLSWKPSIRALISRWMEVFRWCRRWKWSGWWIRGGRVQIWSWPWWLCVQTG